MAGRGGYKETDNILVARLHGTATRHSFAKTPTDEAVAELRAITERVDLLSHAAGMHMARYREDAQIWPMSRAAAALLLAAGADLSEAEAAAGAQRRPS